MLWVTRKKQNFPPVLLALMSLLLFCCNIYALSTKVRMAGYWPSLNSFVDWDEVDFNNSTEKNQLNIHAAILTKQLWLIRDLLPYMAKTRTFSSGTNAGNPERPILPTQGGGGASLPSFFFLREFFSRVLLSERKEQAILKVIKKNWAMKVYPLPFKQQRSDDALQCSDDHVKW